MSDILQAMIGRAVAEITELRRRLAATAEPVTTMTEDTTLLLVVRDAICDTLRALGLEEDGREASLISDEVGCGFHIGDRAIEVMISLEPVEDWDDDEDEDEDEDEDKNEDIKP